MDKRCVWPSQISSWMTLNIFLYFVVESYPLLHAHSLVKLVSFLLLKIKNKNFKAPIMLDKLASAL